MKIGPTSMMRFETRLISANDHTGPAVEATSPGSVGAAPCLLVRTTDDAPFRSEDDIDRSVCRAKRRTFRLATPGRRPVVGSGPICRKLPRGAGRQCPSRRLALMGRPGAEAISHRARAEGYCGAVGA